MRLASYLLNGAPHYGAVVGTGVIELSRRIGRDFPDIKALIARDGLTAAQEAIAGQAADHALADLALLSPVDAPFLGLANGGRYAGVTFLPNTALRVRLGASLNSERLDQFAFDPYSAGTPMLGLLYDPSQTQSLLAGLSWDISGATGIDVNAIDASRSGVPLGVAQPAAVAPRAATRAVSVSARLGLGSGWVTTASFSEGLSQLDLRGSPTSEVREQSYSFSITKHGLFGDDSLGLSLSQPAPSMAGSFASLLGGGDLPPLVVGRGQTLAGRPETDFQLGYVTNFLDGAVALQTNAGYQMNVQGKNGASSVSLLSRAKIKF